MSSYKLYYFNLRGRAEMTRLAFALGKIQYDDVRLNGEEWAKEKASGRPPFGQMPFLVLPDGKILAQSRSICKFVCVLAGVFITFDAEMFDHFALGLKRWTRKPARNCWKLADYNGFVVAGFCPSDVMERTQADMIFDGVEELRSCMTKFYFAKDEGKKEELRSEFFNKTLPAKLVCFEKLLQGNSDGKGFFAGEKLSYADIDFFDVLNSLIAKGKQVVPEQLKSFPLLVDHYNRIMNIPEIKAWLEKRPESTI